MQSLTPDVRKVRKNLKSLNIGQHHALNIFAVKRNVVSEISKVLSNAFAELDGSSWIIHIYKHY